MVVMLVGAIQVDPLKGMLPTQHRIAEMLVGRPGGMMRLQEHFRVALPFGDGNKLGGQTPRGLVISGLRVGQPQTPCRREKL